jgi:nucleotide-binding universal stress UspA family protein
MFETLVVPLDGSDFAAKALPAAVAIARAGNAGLRLVGIARSDAELARVERHVNGTARQVATTKDPEVDVIIDPDPTGALLELANVLCFASHDHRSIATRLIHSVGSALVARAACPIVVVGEYAAQAAWATDVVVAVDGVGDPQPLLGTAISWARELGAPLRIVTVFEPAPEDLD